MAPVDADWRIEQRNIVDFRGQTTMEEACTKAIVFYTDAHTGEKEAVEATHAAGAAKYGVWERMAKVVPPLTRADAQQLANEMAEVLGGDPPSRFWVKVRADQELQHGDDGARRAADVKEGDSVVIFVHEHAPLLVDAITPDRESGTVLLHLADRPLGPRLELEARLLELERADA